MPDPQIKVKIVIKTNYRHEQQTGGQRKFSQRHIEGVLVAVYLNNAGNNCAIDKVEGVVCGRKKGKGGRVTRMEGAGFDSDYHRLTFSDNCKRVSRARLFHAPFYAEYRLATERV